MLKIKNLSFSFAQKKVFSSLNLEILPGEVVAILGSSGIGKTTLLKIISGFYNITSGTIEYREKSRMSFLMQEGFLLPHKTACENALFFSQKQAHDPKALFEELNLLEKMHDYPRSLSGGMKRRIEILRHFLFSPDLLLMDEPFTALDLHNKRCCYQLLKKLVDEQKSILFVTHDPLEAWEFADRLYFQTEQGLINRGEIADYCSFDLFLEHINAQLLEGSEVCAGC